MRRAEITTWESLLETSPFIRSFVSNFGLVINKLAHN
jgi:hypothetical protein